MAAMLPHFTILPVADICFSCFAMPHPLQLWSRVISSSTIRTASLTAALTEALRAKFPGTLEKVANLLRTGSLSTWRVAHKQRRRP